MKQFVKILQEKLNVDQSTYGKEELDWLVQHIGDPSSKIRDDLVCNTFGYGFFDKKFSKDQARYLFDQIKNNNLLFYKIEQTGIPTLTRSFTCLLLLLFIQVNGDKTSRYYRFLDETKEKAIFFDLINYLQNETDFTGYSKKYGWVHAVAHCSDALEICIKQSIFDQEFMKKYLEAVKVLFKKVDRRYQCGEEYHLADTFIAAIDSEKLSTNQLIAWLDDLEIKPDVPELAYQFNNLKSFCLDLYVKLNTKNELNDSLKQFIEKHFSEVY